jgi:hypothetical protein
MSDLELREAFYAGWDTRSQILKEGRIEGKELVFEAWMRQQEPTEASLKAISAARSREELVQALKGVPREVLVEAGIV